MLYLEAIQDQTQTHSFAKFFVCDLGNEVWHAKFFLLPKGSLFVEMVEILCSLFLLVQNC
jgi:hypothetical protein